MPKIQWTTLPAALRDHLFDRLRERQITVEDLYQLKLWRESEPEAPDWLWYAGIGTRPGFLSCCPKGRGFLPPGGRGLADPAFEGAVEGVLGFVAHALRDFRQAVMILAEQLFGKVDTPAGQVAHRGLPDQISEPAGQG